MAESLINRSLEQSSVVDARIEKKGRETDGRTRVAWYGSDLDRIA